MSPKPTIIWNDKLLLALSDVDETIAEVYASAEPAMIAELESYIEEERKLFMVTGGSLERVLRDVTEKIKPALRRDILVSHCSGAEVWGFTDDGVLRDAPFYSVYEDTFTPHMKQQWHEVIEQLVSEFGLRPHAAQPKIDFWKEVGRDPLDIMLDDRGPQITMEVVNGIDLTSEQVKALPYAVPLTHDKYDLRATIMERSQKLLAAAKLPVTPRFGGTFALDFAVAGVTKTTSIQAVLTSPEILETIGLTVSDVRRPQQLEIWGDKFSQKHGGTDLHMCEAVDPQVRSIDFRQENPAEFPAGTNIQVWDGAQHLHFGLQEYLQSRH